MIMLEITKTCRGVKEEDESFRRYDKDTKRFPDLLTANKWLKEIYPKGRKQPMYQDQEDGSAKQVGYIFRYREPYGFEKEDRSGWAASIEEHWVSFYVLEPLEIK